MDTPKAIIIASIILALSIIIAPIALQKFKLVQCMGDKESVYAENYCIPVINGKK